MDGNLEASSNVTGCAFVDTDAILEANSSVEAPEERFKAAAGSKENNLEENVGNKQNEDELQNIDQINIDGGSTESIAEANVNGKRKGRKRKRKKKSSMEAPEERLQAAAGSKENNLEENVGNKQNEDELQNIDQMNIDRGSTESIAEANVNGKRKRRKRKRKKKSGVEAPEERLKAAAGSKENNLEENVGSKQIEDEIQNMDHINIDGGSTESIAEGNVNGKSKRKEGGRKIMELEGTEEGRICENEFPDKDTDISVIKESSLSVLPHDKVSDEIVINEEQCSAEGESIVSICNVEGTSHLSSPDRNGSGGESLSTDVRRITPVPSVKRKLIVLDVNGLLAYIVMPAPKDYRADKHILGRAIFKRPFCDDFLRFCFQNFAVGVWSSRAKKIIEKVVDYLLGDQKDKLLFCWDMSHCTQTGFNTIENTYKPLVFKELKKIWENDDPSLPWKNGDYNASNTLLLDDSPYKALLNPLHTAIFPNSYHYKDSEDNSLGPGGDLRVYLEGVLQSDNVQQYVEQHPFGQSAINETNLSWAFYSGVLDSTSKQLQDSLPVQNLQ